MLASRERRETSIALTSRLYWFETDVLAEERNSQGLARLSWHLRVQPEWAFVTRIHRRSAPFGVYANGDSNVLAVGVKYRF